MKWILLLVLAVSCAALAFYRETALDALFGGDLDLRYAEAGRFEGGWELAGDPGELAEFAQGLERIEFQLIEPAPGSWRAGEPVRASANPGSDRGRGTCVVAGREYSYRQLDRHPHEAGSLHGAWLQLEGSVPFLTRRAYGDGFGIEIEGMRDPANDWLYLFPGRNADGSCTGFAYRRAE